ncbi:hypothetical protein FB451DRAFT_1257362 [Mycena latifolia]|nr:hypothetical protein FB451DRAFT_1257362 [Mycena latifolia]
MDSVATSQSLQQDGDEVSRHIYLSDETSLRLENGPQEEDFDCVPSSQPFEDEDWQTYHGPLKVPITISPPTTPTRQSISEAVTQADATPSGSAMRARRARLIRRASPVKPMPLHAATQGKISRPFNLVRRVTLAPEIARRRKRARDKAHLIIKKLQALARATARLRRQHRELCAFIRETGRKNKENVLVYRRISWVHITVMCHSH